MLKPPVDGQIGLANQRRRCAPSVPDVPQSGILRASSQNRPAVDRAGVIEGMATEDGDGAARVVAAMRVLTETTGGDR